MKRTGNGIPPYNLGFPPGGSPWGFRYSVRIRNIYRSESHLFHRRLDEAMDTEIWKHARLVAIVLG